MAGLLAGIGYAQESHTPGPATASGVAGASPAKSSLPAERVVLKVGNTQVTESEFESSIGDIEPQGGDADKAGAADKDRRKLGDDYASVLMLSQQAIANHLDSSPEVARQLAVDRLQILSDAEFARLLRQAQPTHEEVSEYYSAHLSDYDEVQIRRLFIWKTGGNSKNVHGLTPQDARARADAILQAYAAGRDAAKLAEDFKGSGNGMFDAEPLTFPHGQLPPQMEKVAFAVKEGAWSEVEDTPDSLILIQVVKRDRQPLAQVSATVEQQVQAQKMQAILEDLKKNAGIWMDEKYFGTAVAPVPGAQQPVATRPSKARKSAEK
jgi:parvulin-like peptidyl-prolyl isomerase